MSEEQIRKEFFQLSDKIHMCERCGTSGTGFCSFGYGWFICIQCAGETRGNVSVDRVINLRGYNKESVRTTWIQDFFKNRQQRLSAQQTSSSSSSSSSSVKTSTLQSQPKSVEAKDQDLIDFENF